MFHNLLWELNVQLTATIINITTLQKNRTLKIFLETKPPETPNKLAVHCNLWSKRSNSTWRELLATTALGRNWYWISAWNPTYSLHNMLKKKQKELSKQHKTHSYIGVTVDISQLKDIRNVPKSSPKITFKT